MSKKNFSGLEKNYLEENMQLFYSRGWDDAIMFGREWDDAIMFGREWENAIEFSREWEGAIISSREWVLNGIISSR